MLWRRDLGCRGGCEADSEGSMSSSERCCHSEELKELWLSVDAGEWTDGLLEECTSALAGYTRTLPEPELFVYVTVLR